MISYEVSLGLIIIGIVISTGSLNFGDIVRAQDTELGPVQLVLAAAPADGGRCSSSRHWPRPTARPSTFPRRNRNWWRAIMVEYSSTPYLLFMAGEYIAIFLMCALTSLLFFGGWLSPIPGLPDGWWWMVAKMWFFFFLFAMVKAIVPRYRYDQLMRIGWKVFLPLSLGWVVLIVVPCKIRSVRRLLGPLDDGGLIMSNIDYTRAAKYFLLMDFSRALAWG
jgi:NADH-quinone oxidoreductase subunit H